MSMCRCEVATLAVETPGSQSQASCFPLFPVFMVSQANNLQAPATYSRDQYESGKSIFSSNCWQESESLFLRKLNYSFNSKHLMLRNVEQNDHWNKKKGKLTEST